MSVIKKRQKRNSISKLISRRNKYGYVFILPWLIGLAAFFIIPLIQTIGYSFSNVSIGDRGVDVVFSGLSNYQRAFLIDPSYLRLLAESVFGMLYDIPLILVFSLLAATLLNQKFHGRWLARLIFFLPVIYGTGLIIKLQQSEAIYGVIASRANTVDGDNVSGAILEAIELKNIIMDVALKFPPLMYLVDAVDRIFSIVNRSGVQILIFLTGLTTISPNYYEAGSIDGASGWEKFWQITFPLVYPYLLMNSVFTVIDSFTQADNNVISYITDITFRTGSYSYGAAMSLVYFMIISLFLVIVTFILSRYHNTEM